MTQKSARIPGKASGYSCGCVTLLVRVRRLHWEFYFIFKPRRDLVSLMFVLDYLVFVGFVRLFFPGKITTYGEIVCCHEHKAGGERAL